MPGSAAPRRGLRMVLLWVLTLLLLAVVAPAASAHTRAGVASDYESRITSAPALEGVRWRVYAGGDVIELTNAGPTEVLVLGYAGEPYLRVGADGVLENRNSPAAYLNADRDGDVAVPPRADAEAVPDWVRVGEGRSVTWHDHRVHWMSRDLPPSVEGDPGRTVLVKAWQVPLEQDDHAHALTGELWWVPGPSPWPYLAVALLATTPALAGVLRRRSGHGLRRPAALVVAVVAAVNGIHFVDEFLAWPASTLDVLFGVFHTALFVGAGLAGAIIAWHGRQGPHLSLGIASGAVLFHQGLLQLRLLTSSQLPTVWPPGVMRLTVALSVAQAVWVAVVLTASARHPAGDRDDHGPRHEPGRSTAPARPVRSVGAARP